jgi:hypothetical protein
MRTIVISAVAATVVGAASALAQAPQEAPQDPTITQNGATTPNAQQPNDQAKPRMPMRRELPPVAVPPNAASEGAGAGTEGSDLPPKPIPSQPQQSQ